MKSGSFILILAVALAFAADASAELYLKQVSKQDEFYDGTPQGGEEITLEMWFGAGRAAVVVDGRRIVFEPGERRIRVVSEGDTTYCEIALPVVRDSVFTSDYKARLDRWFYDGSVTKTAETKNIRGRRCAAFAGQQWIQLGEDRYSEIDKAYWMTADPSPECRLLNDLQAAILSLVNNSPGYLEATRKLEGLLLEGEVTVYDRGNRIVTRVRTDALEERTPPAGLYSVPAGYRRLDRLPRDAFLVLLRIPD